MKKDILVKTWDGKNAVCVEGRFYGWAFYKHPDGQWVTIRKASDDEIDRAKRKFEVDLKQEQLRNTENRSTT